jgi:hypothetical protein
MKTGQSRGGEIRRARGATTLTKPNDDGKRKSIVRSVLEVHADAAKVVLRTLIALDDGQKQRRNTAVRAGAAKGQIGAGLNAAAPCVATGRNYCCVCEIAGAVSLRLSIRFAE